MYRVYRQEWGDNVEYIRLFTFPFYAFFSSWQNHIHSIEISPDDPSSQYIHTNVSTLIRGFIGCIRWR